MAKLLERKANLIDEHQYEYDRTLTSIVIPEGVEYIGGHAFEGCRNLREVILPEGLLIIGNRAFKDCINLEKIVIPDTVLKLCAKCFDGCNKLDIVIPSGVQELGYGLFENRDDIEEIVIPDNVRLIEKQLFKNCKNLKRVILPEHITEIPDECFKNCPNLVEVIAPGVKRIGERAFENCSSLTSFLENATQFCSDCYRNCTSLDDVNINSSVSYLPDGMFEGCKSLKNINYSGDGLCIGERCFKNCISLKSTPTFISNFALSAFENCISLETVNIVSRFIPKACFKGCIKLKNVIGQEKIYNIKAEAFSRCESLEEFSLYHVESVTNDAFNGCKRLKRVQLNNRIRRIGKRAFYGCEALEEFNFPEALDTVQKEAFRNCNSLREITIGPYLKNIEPLAFGFMGSLECINVDPSNSTFITPDNKILINSLYQTAVLYANGSKDKSYSLKDYNYVVECLGHELVKPVAVISEYAFAGAKNLETLTLCSCTKDVEKNAFLGCDKLKNLRIEVIPFYSSPGIDIRSKGEYYTPEFDKEKAYLPFENVEFIGDVSTIYARALKHFENVTSVTLPDNGSYEIGTGAFSDCSKLKSISIPSSVSSIQDNAFNPITTLNFENGLSVTGLVKLINDNKLIGPYKLYILHDGTYYIEQDGNLTSISKKYIDNVCSNSEFVRDDPILFLEFMNFLGQSELLVRELFNGIVMKHMGTSSREILTNSLKRDDNFFLRVIREGNLFNEEDNCSLLLLQDDGFQNVVDYVNILKKYNITDSALYNKFFMAKYPSEKFEKLINYDYNLLLKIARDSDLFCDEEVSLLYENRVNKHNSHFLTIQILEKDLLSKFMAFVKKHNITDPYLFGKSFIINHENKLVNNLFRVYDANIKRLLKNSLVTSNSFTTKENLINLLILMKITGALEDDPVVRQRASTFITEKMFLEYLPNGEKNRFRIVGDDIHRIFDFPYANDVFNPEFAEFFFENFQELITEEKKTSGFIQRVYYNFNKIKKTSLSNKGSQRQLKVTMDKCKTYLYAYMDFPGVTDETRKLAEKVGYWFGTESAWKSAERLYYESLTAPRNIFTKYEEDEYGDKIFDNDASYDLREKINPNYSYEWLPKQDIDNMFLGKYCNCCAHVDGAGRGIMRASMIHPDCQNLVIRNQDGEIISKATIFVNREEGYGVFNTVETNFNYRSDDDIKKIYNAFIRGVEAFIDTYNKNNNEKPITRITIGTNRNTLSKYLNDKKHPDTETLESLQYSEFSHNTSGYSGDWMYGQKLVLKR